MNIKKISLNHDVFPLQDILCKTKTRKIFLVTGKNSFKNVEPLVGPYLRNFEVNKFDDFDNNPKFSDILKGIEKYKRFKPDIVIAVGGGSSIDMAKSINFLSKQTEPLLSILEGKTERINNCSIPLIVLPTTAGTGSEATSFSVVYVDKLKYSLAHPDILPDYIVADSSLVFSVPKYIAGCSGFDALTQALESFWSKNSTPESDEFALKAIKLLVCNIDNSVSQPSKSNLEKMVQGSFYSGKAINITRTTVPHALSYILTSHFGIPHGHAVATFFAPTLHLTYKLAKSSTKAKIEKIFDFFNVNNAASFEKKWYDLMEKCHLKSNLLGYNLNISHVELIVSNVNIERLSGHPVNFSKTNLTDIVKRVFI